MNIFLAMKLRPSLPQNVSRALIAATFGAIALGATACGGADERDTDRTSLSARAKHSAMYFDEKAAVRPAAESDTGAVDGATVYAACAACHQQSGTGMAGAWPPLAGSEWLVNNPEVPIRIVLNGMHGAITVKGESYNNVMQAWRDQLSDDKIAAVLTYARSSWGNNASAVTTEQVAAVREATKDRTESWTAEELKDLIHAQ